jgi:hypothetical protein
MAKIELPECWAGVAEPLRALLAEVNARRARTEQRRWIPTSNSTRLSFANVRSCPSADLSVASTRCRSLERVPENFFLRTLDAVSDRAGRVRCGGEAAQEGQHTEPQS